MESRSFLKSWGADYVAEGVVNFRLWAPGQERVTLRLAGVDHIMRRSDEGWFELQVS
ncbi:MAG TPA: malto-oligosyltrehalose trehalohydrolase, partial [Franconibacter helveticus]|nr:malto-oligosyltrehalose trehalohydrolase [Franconibacter helveticus]